MIARTGADPHRRRARRGGVTTTGFGDPWLGARVHESHKIPQRSSADEPLLAIIAVTGAVLKRE
jgi:hypothetical protein